MFRTADIFISEYIIKTFDSLFQAYPTEQSLIVQEYGDYREQFITGTDTIYASFYLNRSKNSLEYVRKTYGISNLLSDMGGFTQSIFTIAAIIVGLYNQEVYTLMLANETYDFDLIEKNDNKKKEEKEETKENATNPMFIRAQSQQVTNRESQNQNQKSLFSQFQGRVTQNNQDQKESSFQGAVQEFVQQNKFQSQSQFQTRNGDQPRNIRQKSILKQYSQQFKKNDDLETSSQQNNNYFTKDKNQKENSYLNTMTIKKVNSIVTHEQNKLFNGQQQNHQTLNQETTHSSSPFQNNIFFQDKWKSDSPSPRQSPVMKESVKDNIERLQRENKRKDFLQNNLDIVFQQRKKLKITFGYFIFLLTCEKFFRTKENIMIKNSKGFLNRDADIVHILNKIKELEKVKYLLLNKDQLTLFNYFPKPLLHYDENQNIEINSQIQDNMMQAAKNLNISSKYLNTVKTVNSKFKQISQKKEQNNANRKSSFFKITINQKQDKLEDLVKLYEAYERIVLLAQKHRADDILIKMLGDKVKTVLQESFAITFGDRKLVSRLESSYQSQKKKTYKQDVFHIKQVSKQLEDTDNFLFKDTQSEQDNILDSGKTIPDNQQSNNKLEVRNKLDDEEINQNQDEKQKEVKSEEGQEEQEEQKQEQKTEQNIINNLIQFDQIDTSF